MFVNRDRLRRMLTNVSSTLCVLAPHCPWTAHCRAAGIFPIPGLTVLMGVLLSIVFGRQNVDWKLVLVSTTCARPCGRPAHVSFVVQLANLLVTPLALALLPVFLLAGDLLPFWSSGGVSPSVILAALQASVIAGVLAFTGALVKAVLVWALLAIPAVWGLAYVTQPLARFIINRLTR